ncbi:MAG: hypothetical protein GC151_14650 [Betaproteobacteria bacterium]|nr:hypothetical protein [Betaproteobacteria bacterium]
MHTKSILVVTFAVIAAIVLFHPRILASRWWRATITPLASIIGSGFLVLAPILVRNFGHGAVWVMAALCACAYAIGAAIRWNIRALDDSAGPGRQQTAEVVLERFSSLALSFAYVVSVCYYLNLFGAFAVSLTDFQGSALGKVVTTAILAVIGAIGWTRGFRGLERAETLSVGLKLAVIAGLLVGMGTFTATRAGTGFGTTHTGGFDVDSVRMAFGLLITVQGFETSRYLADEYDTDTRIATMRYAQWISALIYMAYIGMASLDFSPDGIGTSETAVIQMSRQIAVVLPFLLILAALASQFSAAVADTNGYGGLTEEITGGRLRTKAAYVLLVVACIGLTWLANIYEIISYASRAFAIYYGLQCAVATLSARRISGWSWTTAAFASLTLLAATIAVFGVPVESS